MNDAWHIKRELSSCITNKEIDKLYNYGIENGAIGGKILGAGGGGFLMLYASQKIQTDLQSKFRSKNSFNIKVDTAGTRLTYYDHDF